MTAPLHRFSERSLPAWQELFCSSSREEERYLALQAMAQLSEPAQTIPWMLQGLQDADSGVRASAARWLVTHAGRPAWPGTDEERMALRSHWENLLRDLDPDVRFEAARGLLVLNPSHQLATAELTTLLHDPDTQPAMLAAVLQALTTGQGPWKKLSLNWPPLVQHPQAEVREQAARTLGLRGERSAELAHLLLPLVEDEEPFVREEAVKALGELHVSSETILHALDLAATDEDALIAETAQFVLQRLR